MQLDTKYGFPLAQPPPREGNRLRRCHASPPGFEGRAHQARAHRSDLRTGVVNALELARDAEIGSHETAA
jgi:hypothetical protein